jgi:hypothetical protein
MHFCINKQQKSGLHPYCKKCKNENSSKYYKKNTDIIKQKRTIYVSKIQSCPNLKAIYKNYHRNYNKKYRKSENYKLRRLEIKNKRKIENNPYKNNLKINFPELYNIRQRDAVKRYRKKHPDKISNYRTKRRMIESQAVPNWLNETDLFNIRLIYLKRDFISEVTGIPHHVDHIHPLKNKYLCGLHVPWNLQILSASDNLKKSNKLDIKY